MWGYIVRRVLAGLLMLFAMTLLTFAFFRLIPLSPGCLIVPCGPGSTSTDADIRAAEHRLGTDRSVPVQYAKFMWRIIRHGDFGTSWTTGIPINDQLKNAAPKTVSVLVGGALLLFLLAVPLGVISAIRAQQKIDRLILFFLLFGVALHPFIIGVFFKRFFADTLHLTPGGGYCDFLHAPAPVEPAPGFPPGPPPCGGLGAWAHSMVLPWITFAAFFLPLYTRMVRNSVVETLDAAHVTAARARGASEFRVIRAHVLKPALLPLTTMIGMDLGGALMASIYIETIYFLGGIGTTMLNAVNGRQAAFGFDLPLIAAMFFCIAVVVILLNMIVDLVYAGLDPRVRVR
jgi:peptide/nickel transport system permease protein